MSHVQRAMDRGLLNKIDGRWVTPFGTYKYLSNAMRFLRKHIPLGRAFDFDKKLIGVYFEQKPFLLKLRIGKK